MYPVRAFKMDVGNEFVVFTWVKVSHSDVSVKSIVNRRLRLPEKVFKGRGGFRLAATENTVI